MKLREKLARFMAGRYGNDQLNRFLSYFALALIILALFIQNTIGSVLNILGLTCLIVIYIRMLSRNIYKRQEENGKYLRLKYKLTSSFRAGIERFKQRKEYRFFKCPSCKTVLRVPRGKGKIRITCRKCGTAFEKKT